MRRFIDDPNVADDMLDGYVGTHASMVRRIGGGRVVAVANPEPHRVRVITGGGSGHEPALFGYVGPGFLDAAVVGDLFASPPVSHVLEALDAIDTGEGVLVVIGNYPGDVLNFRMAAESARRGGHMVEMEIVTDDVGAGIDDLGARRGLAGGVLVWKVAGAAAASGAPLTEVHRVAHEANARARTVAVALGGPVVPGSDHPSFTVADEGVSFGAGHGEPGIRNQRYGGIGPLIEEMVDHLLRAGNAVEEPVVTLLNGLGATSLQELYVAQRHLREELDRRGLRIHRSYVGPFYTVLDTAGLSVTLLSVTPELVDLIDAPATTPHFCQTH